MKALKKVQEINALMCVVGALVYSLGFVLFLKPVSLYTGGFMGIAQLVALPFQNTFFASVNVEGIIYLIMNIPMLIIGLLKLGKRFMATSILTAVAESLFVLVIPSPTVPIMSDMLTSCVIGGCIEGLGSVITFNAFSSGGGTDILGILLCRKFPKLTVGVVSIIVNIIVYGICAFLFSIEIAILSFITSLCASLVTDRLHQQRKSVAVNILSKEYEKIKEYIINDLDRGATISTCIGAYSGEQRHMVIAIMSEYELKDLEEKVNELDEGAFIFIHPVNVIGDFERRFSKK